MAGKGHSSNRGRDAGTGQFIPVKEARQRPNATTVERVPKPGYGADSSTPRGRDAKTGEFIPVEEARSRPRTAVVERVPNPGQGSGS
jgi:hypothetical protein